jgi:hypothetical protein
MDPATTPLMTAAQLTRRGCDRNAQHRLVEAGHLARIAPAVFVEMDDWNLLDDRGRAVVRTRGIALARPRPLVVSHVTAALLHDLPIVGGLPSRVDSLRSDVGGGRSEGSIRAHRCASPPPTLEIMGMQVTTLPRTLIDVALTNPLVVAVPMLDHALHTRSCRLDELRDEWALRRRHPSARRAGVCLDLATPLSESPLESILQVRLFEGGWARPRQQAKLPLSRGGNAYVDCLFDDQRLVLEADGRFKYGPVAGLLTGAELWKEKQREDDLREQGFDFRRPTWDRVWRRAAFDAMMQGTRVPRAARG